MQRPLADNSAAAPIPTFKDAQRESGEVLVEGQGTLELTAKEYALLEYLMCSPERVFSRTMILNHVWDQSFEGVTNIVDVYVRYVRKKVDEPFAVKLIHTVRGVGYCIRGSESRRGVALE